MTSRRSCLRFRPRTFLQSGPRIWQTLPIALTLAVLFSTVANAQTDDDPGAVAPDSTEASPPPSPPADPNAAAADVTSTGAAGDETGAAPQVASFAVTKLKDSPAVVTVISGEDIRTSGARDLIDILNMVPGYFVGQDVQNIVGAGFRGLWGEEGKILLMIDGKEINELMFSTLQLDNGFPVELIERVEVVRGQVRSSTAAWLSCR